jgi:transcription initiation factor TFIIB
MAPEVVELSPGEVQEALPPLEAEPWQQNLKVRLVCKDCKEDPPNIAEQHSDGDLVCASCGNVLAMHTIDTRSEWRSFQNDDQGNDDPSRVGAAHNPTLDIGPQLTSGIQFDNKSTYARDLSRAQNKLSDDKGSKQLQEAMTQIQDICASENWKSNVSQTAKQIYKTTWESKKFRSKNQDAIIAGCIFLACRQEQSGRTFKEIAKITKVPKKEIGRVFKQLEHFMHEKKKTKRGAQEIGQFQKTEAIDPKTLCLRFGHQLGLENHVSSLAGECAILLSSTGLLAGRSPLSVAAVALYAISHFLGHPRDLKAISKAASVSEGTIKSAWKSIYLKHDKFVLPEWKERSNANMANLPAVA